MKEKVKKTQKVFTNMIRTSLMSCVLTFNCVLGDVVVDPAAGVVGAIVAANAQLPAFVAYVNANAGAGNATPPAGIVVNFIGGINWQMCGFAVFVNNAGVA